MVVDCEAGGDGAVDGGGASDVPLAHARIALALGAAAPLAARRAAVLVLGAGEATGAEAATALVLSGVGRVALSFNGRPRACTLLSHRADAEDDAVAAYVARLAVLDPTCTIDVLSGDPAQQGAERMQAVGLTSDMLAGIDVVVACDDTGAALSDTGRARASICRTHGVPYVAACARGALCAVFADFGARFQYERPAIASHGDASASARMSVVESIHATPDTGGAAAGGSVTLTVTIADEGGHGLEDGDLAEFVACESASVDAEGANAAEAAGTGGESLELGAALNAAGPLPCTVTGRATLLVQCEGGCGVAAAAAAGTQAYVSGSGYLRQVRGKVCGSHVSLDEALAPGRLGDLSTDADREVIEVLRHCARGGNPLELARTHASAGCEGGDGAGGSSPGIAALAACAACAMENNGAGYALPPVATVAGAVAAAEAVKAVTRVHQPLHQWFTYHAAELLSEVGHAPQSAEQEPSPQPIHPALAAQEALLGGGTRAALASARVVVAGAAAVGCEVIKNLALLGVGADGARGGDLTIVDGDDADECNLSRQVLHAIGDQSVTRAAAAVEAVRSIGPCAPLHSAHAVDASLSASGGASSGDLRAVRLAMATKGAVLASCAEGAAARLAADALCLGQSRNLVDVGVNGPLGSVTSAVPFESEPYSASTDPPERRAQPQLCVLNNFPYLPAHASAWARERFEDIFVGRPRAVNEYLSHGRDEFVAAVRGRNGAEAAEGALRGVRDSLGRSRPRSLEECAAWAAALFEELFEAPVNALLSKFGPDSLTTEGLPFWAGVKRCPTPLALDANDELHARFVRAAANLRAHVYGLHGTAGEEAVRGALRGSSADGDMGAPASETLPLSASASSMAIEDGPDAEVAGTKAADTVEARIAALLEELPSPGELVGFRLKPLSLARARGGARWHVDFLQACAALRARNHRIPPPTRAEVLRDAAGVAPALPPATSLIAALGTVEILKAILGARLAVRRDSFANTALPSLVCCVPRRVAGTAVATAKGTQVFSVWDKLEVDLRACDATLGAMIATFEEKYGIEVSMVSYGSSLLFMDFMAPPKLKERKATHLVELLATIAKTALPPDATSLELSLSCTDANDDDVDGLGGVRVLLR